MTDPRVRQLRSMKRRATGLLLLAAAVFVAARTYEDNYAWLEYVRATAEAAMVGGLADWFAVTALFRHPLGLRIPHTAIIKNRKDQLGRSLGDFVQDNFLAADIVVDKINAAHVAERIGVWLSAERNQAMVSKHAAAAIAGGVGVLRDDEVQGAIEAGLLGRLRRVEAAPIAGRVLEIASADGRHHELVDAAARGALRFLDQGRDELRGRFARESPWWVPEQIDDRIFDKLYTGLRRFIEELIDDPRHELRQHLDARLAVLIERLGSDPDLIARGERFKDELLAHPAVRSWMSSIWTDFKRAIVAQSADEDSELRRRIEQTARSFGEALAADEALRAKVDQWVEGAVRYVVAANGREVANLIESTVEKWDADEASTRIELQVGRDLQFIRINGTLVGGAAGLAIHSIGALL